jgi:hypothetical protein
MEELQGVISSKEQSSKLNLPSFYKDNSNLDNHWVSISDLDYH